VSESNSTQRCRGDHIAELRVNEQLEWFLIFMLAYQTWMEIYL